VAPLIVLGLVALVSAGAAALRRRWRDAALGFAVTSTGLVEIAVEFLILLGFQVVYGYVYEYIGILVASFMLGLTVGAWVSSGWVVRGRASWRRMEAVQLCICAYPMALLGLLVAATRSGAALPPALAGGAFSLVALAAGVVGGLQFPLAAALHSSGGGSAGTLYGLDLLGSCLGALAVSSVLVATFGLGGVCGLLSALGGLGLVGLAAAGRAKSG
jgi:spermidine synthase